MTCLKPQKRKKKPLIESLNSLLLLLFSFESDKVGYMDLRAQPSRDRQNNTVVGLRSPDLCLIVNGIWAVKYARSPCV